MENRPRPESAAWRRNPEEEVREALREIGTGSLAKNTVEALYQRLVQYYVHDSARAFEGSRTVFEQIAKERAREILVWEAGVEAMAKKERTAAVARLKDKLAVRISIAAVVASGVGDAAAAAAYGPGIVETYKEARTEETRVDVEAMEPEATPERMQRILETFPQSWAHDVAVIGYKDEDGPTLEHYGLPNDRAAANAVERPSQRAGITYYRNYREATPYEKFGGTLLHEVAHANDWRTDGDMDAVEAKALHAAVLVRVGATDRHKSSYVESINNEDKLKEAELRAIEYWAEISRAYLESERPTEVLSAEDIKLVEGQIARHEPGFDRAGARERRLEVIREIAEPKFASRLDGFLDSQQTLVGPAKEHWRGLIMDRWRVQQTAVTGNQNALRVELIKLVDEIPEGSPKRDVVRLRLFVQSEADRLAGAIWCGDTDKARARLLATAALDKSAEDWYQRAGEVAPSVIAETDAVVVDKGLVLGKGVSLKSGEYETLLDGKSTHPTWLVETAGWTPNNDDRGLVEVMNPLL